ncbi:MAG: hypothetical protein JNL87_19600 [Burkholderiaceae bacterium]|nr:hypothetical protein [Burkholderiaceae bacterium]
MPMTSPTTPLPCRRLFGRALLLAPWAALAGCASPWPELPPGAGSSSARQRLRDSAEAHGAAAWAGLCDLNLAVDRLWLPDGGLAGPAQLRWLPGAGTMAIQTTGGEHRSTTWRRRGSGDAARSWRDGAPVAAPQALAAGALQSDLYRLLWLGPVAVAESPGAVNWAEPETLDGRRCDHLHLALVPGLGEATADRLSLFIDRDEGRLRRLRVSLNGLGAAGGVAEIDVLEQRRLHGVLWPTRCRAGAARGLGQAPAAWQLTGLDVNRGYGPAAIEGPAWSGLASAPPPPLPGD